MPLTLTIEQGGGAPSSSQECVRLMRRASASGRRAEECLWHGWYYLMGAARMKRPRPQAQNILLAWCGFASAMRYSPELGGCRQALEQAGKALRVGMEVWPDDIDEPRKRQLAKARSRKRTLQVSEKAVEEFEEFRGIFAIETWELAAGLDLSMFREPWCIPTIDKYLDYWREQLAFIKSQIAEAAEGEE